MKRPLPSSNFAANRRAIETSRNLTRGTLNLGVGAFKSMFPTLGRFVNKIEGGGSKQEKTDTVSRRTRASVDVGLSRSNNNLGTILNNQHIQNQLLERLLSSLKATSSNQPSSNPIIPGGAGDLISNILTGLGLLSLIPAIKKAFTSRAPAATPPATRPPAPAATPPATRPPAPTPAATPTATPTATRPPAPTPAARVVAPLRAIAAGAGLLARFAGPIGMAYSLYDGMQQLASELTNSLAGPRLTFTRIVQSLRENIEVLRTLEQQLRDEQDEQKAAELGVDIERTLRNIESQRGRILEIAIILDRAESRRRNTTNRVSFTLTVQRLLGESSSFTPQQTSIIPAPPSVPSVPPPPSATTIPAPPSVPSVPPPPSATTIPAPPSVPQVPAPSAEAATRVDSNSALYEFEKILFEADLIRFDGPSNLQAPTATAVNQPSVSSTNLATTTTNQSTQISAGNISASSGNSTTSTMQPSAGGSAMTATGPSSSGNAEPAATRVGGTSVSSSPAQVTGTTAQILTTIRQKESGSNYQAQSRASSASGAYQFIDGTWRSLTRQFNIGTEFNRAVEAPPAVQDAVAAAYVNQILSRNNGNVSVVPLVWYTGNAQGNMSAAALATNRGLTPQEYQRQWMQSFASLGGSIPANSTQTQVASTPSAGPAMVQASTARVSADRQQASMNQRASAEFQQQTLQRQQQDTSNTPSRQTGNQRTGGEVPLKTRLLSTFDQLAKAS